MYPILFKFGFVNIYSYGLMIALAFLVSGSLFSRKVYALGQTRDFAWNLSSWILVGGVLGGRIAYILLNFEYFLSNPGEIFMVWHGGLVWYGGFIGGFLSGIVYSRIKKVHLVETLDLIAPFIALGQAIGRVGCLLNGCCYWKQASWGLYFPVFNEYLIPTQIFSSLALLVIFFVLRLLQDRPHRQGSVFVIYLLLYSLKRFMMEFIRGDSARSYFGLTIFQIFSLGLFLVAFCLWITILKSSRKKKVNA